MHCKDCILHVASVTCLYPGTIFLDGPLNEWQHIAPPPVVQVEAPSSPAPAARDGPNCEAKEGGRDEKDDDDQRSEASSTDKVSAIELCARVGGSL